MIGEELLVFHPPDIVSEIRVSSVSCTHPGGEPSEMWQIWCPGENVIYLLLCHLSTAASQITSHSAACSNLFYHLVLWMDWAQRGSCLGFLLWVQSDDSVLEPPGGLDRAGPPGGLTQTGGSWELCPFSRCFHYMSLPSFFSKQVPIDGHISSF